MSGAVAALAGMAGVPGIIQGIASGAGASPQSATVGNTGGVSVGATAGSWVLPANAGVAALYQVKVDVTGGSFTSGDATGSYLDCSSTRTWTRTGAGTVTFNVTFREKASGLVRGGTTGATLTVV
jgi:hypothetical protein